ncbi:type VII secretion-associated protein [Corynebacterium uterequi]|uniref:Type VII secretion-associated protein n=1 Tax=Corynebacterium uterequi TaxID=1072256 RepID=A0A0G3HEL5_9CORY|nr:type VII secretion-associated protein [Corynebacterium uterequi]AKK10413.1 type VII secretion-associated protein [Corynebacterium uterequi]
MSLTEVSRPTLHVTVFDSATVFDGVGPDDVVYRYDLPGASYAEGWARDAVVEQIAALAGTHWPEVTVTIDASADAAEQLNEWLLDEGVRVIDALGVGEDPATVVARAVGAVEAGEDTAVAEETPGEQRRRWVLLAAAVAALFALGVVAVVVWGRVTAPDTADSAVVSSPPPAQSSEAKAAEPPASPSPSPSAEPTETLTLDAVKVTLPEGYQLAAGDAGTVVATGPDPDTRLHLVVQPAGGAPEQVLDQLALDVDADPQLIAPERAAESFSYAELPGDGSQVAWHTWFEGENQLVVGCHYRRQPSVAGQRACEMARDTLTHS